MFVSGLGPLGGWWGWAGVFVSGLGPLGGWWGWAGVFVRILPYDRREVIKVVICRLCCHGAARCPSGCQPLFVIRLCMDMRFGSIRTTCHRT